MEPFFKDVKKHWPTFLPLWCGVVLYVFWECLGLTSVVSVLLIATVFSLSGAITIILALRRGLPVDSIIRTGLLASFVLALLCAVSCGFIQMLMEVLW